MESGRSWETLSAGKEEFSHLTSLGKQKCVIDKRTLLATVSLAALNSNVSFSIGFSINWHLFLKAMHT
jgi:hypothetical protein